MAGSLALLVRLSRERYEFRPPWGVTQRCRPGGISLHGAPHPKVLPGRLGLRVSGVRSSRWGPCGGRLQGDARYAVAPAPHDRSAP